MKTRRVYAQESQRAVGNQDSALKGLVHKLTCSESQLRGSRLKASVALTSLPRLPQHAPQPMPGSGPAPSPGQGGGPQYIPGKAQPTPGFGSSPKRQPPVCPRRSPSLCPLPLQPSQPRQWPVNHPRQIPGPHQAPALPPRWQLPTHPRTSLFWLQPFCPSHQAHAVYKEMLLHKDTPSRLGEVTVSPNS